MVHLYNGVLVSGKESLSSQNVCFLVCYKEISKVKKKKDDIMSFGGKWMELEDIMLSEVT